MSGGPSTLSLAAAGLYVIVAALCAIAGMTAGRRRQAPWHGHAWLALAALFVLLSVLRVLDLETSVRDSLRLVMRLDGTYSERRDIQRPALAIAILIGAGLALYWANLVRKTGRSARDRTVLAAGSAALALIGLVGLRWLSLHAIDAVLYGPAKINWVVDIGASLFVAGAALYYARLLMKRRG